MNPLRSIVGLLTLGLASCGALSDAWMTGRTATVADNRVMLVRAQPPSFGQQRLDYQAGLYPDLGIFLTKFGAPDFPLAMNCGRLSKGASRLATRVWITRPTLVTGAKSRTGS